MANSSSELKGRAAWTNLLSVLTSSPATKGLVGAFFVQLTPWNDQITSALWIPSRIVIVLALMVVGIRLGSFGSVNQSTNRTLFSLVGPSLLIKLMFLPALMLALAKVFGLSTLMSNALVLQAATPTAISVLLLAEASGKEQHVAASLVVWSTLISLATIPIWYLVLQSIN